MSDKPDQDGLISMDTSTTTSSQGGEFDGDIDDLDMMPPINRRNDIGISDQDLIVLSTKQLNKLIKKRGISKERARTIKEERRTLKNRGYAANCRVKRENIEERYKVENEELRQKLDATYAEIESVNVSISVNDQTLASAVKELEVLRNKAFQFNIKAPEALGPQSIETALSRLRFKPTIAAEVARLDHRGSNSLESLLASKPEIRFEKIREEQ